MQRFLMAMNAAPVAFDIAWPFQLGGKSNDPAWTCTHHKNPVRQKDNLRHRVTKRTVLLNCAQILGGSCIITRVCASTRARPLGGRSDTRHGRSDPLFHAAGQFIREPIGKPGKGMNWPCDPSFGCVPGSGPKRRSREPTSTKRVLKHHTAVRLLHRRSELAHRRRDKPGDRVKVLIFRTPRT